MNDTPYGLTAAVFSSNRQRAEAILQQVHTFVNPLVCTSRFLPFFYSRPVCVFSAMHLSFVILHASFCVFCGLPLALSCACTPANI